MKDSRELTVWN